MIQASDGSVNMPGARQQEVTRSTALRNSPDAEGVARRGEAADGDGVPSLDEPPPWSDSEATTVFGGAIGGIVPVPKFTRRP